ncbi:MAG: hypothetical protein Q8L48_15255 [Archangium sp.]|nr:hypothetical protein [Archangium sp.]
MNGALLSLLLAGCNCTEPILDPVLSFIRVEPGQIDFGRLVVGQASARNVEVINSGKAPIDGTWSLRGDGFLSDDANPSRAAVGSTLMTLRCAPQAVGLFDGQLEVALVGLAPITVPLACEGVPVPECTPSAPCRTAAFDLVAGRCVEQDQPNGTSCAAGDVCLLDAVCNSGRCEGTPRDCGDGDPCTSDTCHPSRGCEHTGPIACPGEGVCRVGRCAPGLGCELADAPDGVPCGQARSCTSADVCIAGACVRRDPPDGFECVPTGPCGDAGYCVNDVCEPGPLFTLASTWSLNAPQPDGGPPEAWSDLFADRNGTLTVSSYFMSPPRLSANSAMPVTLTQTGRRCIDWLGWVVCGDLPGNQSSPVSALDPTSGQIVWSYSSAAQVIPEFAGPSAQFFTARLAVLSENELLALYESRTMTPEGADPRCRTFGMVVIDRQGQGQRSLFINDPIFTVCDHPHSYGVAVDAQSNIYLAFTPSGADNPATSLGGTMIFSFTPALQLRWRRFVPGLVGGELAVADGVLFQERSAEVRLTQTGDVAAVLARPFGLGVVGDGTAVTTQAGSQTLSTLATRTSLPRWQRTLTGTLGRTPLTAATWASPWGPRDVALAFTTDGAQVRLEGTELLTGAAAFSCPIALSELPAMTAITPGGLGVMLGTVPVGSGWPVCDDCDPKYARTRSSFQWFPLRGLSPSSAPWSGAWGNEGHSHHEGR